MTRYVLGGFESRDPDRMVDELIKQLKSTEPIGLPMDVVWEKLKARISSYEEDISKPDTPKINTFGSHIEDLRTSPVEIIKWKSAQGTSDGQVELKDVVMAARVGSREVLIETGSMKITLFNSIDREKLKK